MTTLATIANPAGITMSPFLSEQECETIAKTVLELKVGWTDVTHQTENTPFHGLVELASLGFSAASARRLDPSRTDFSAEIARVNRRLLAHFPTLHERICRRLETVLDAPVRLVPTLPLPGFNIFRTIRAGIPHGPEYGGRVHYDRPDVIFDSRDGQLKTPSWEIVFSVPILQFEHGDGVNVLPHPPEHIRPQILDRFFHEMPSEGRSWTLDNLRYQPYSRGDLILFNVDTLALHQIANMVPVASDECRIIFQGHAGRLDGEWVLYFTSLERP